MRFFFSVLLSFLVLFHQCKKWDEPPRLSHIPKEALYIKKLRLWEYKNQKEEIVWYEDGQLFRKAEKKGELYHGIFRQFFKNGRISQEGKYEEGFRIGKWFYYFKDGNIYLVVEYKKEPYDPLLFSPNSVYGNENGTYKRYYPNGQLEEEGNYFAGKYDGKRIQYYKNGNIRFIGYYNKGLKEGEWFFYDVNQKLIRKELYKNDSFVKVSF